MFKNKPMLNHLKKIIIKLFTFGVKKKKKVLFGVIKLILGVLCPMYFTSDDILFLFLSSFDNIDLNLIVSVVYNTNTDIITVYFSDKSYKEMPSTDFLNLLVQNPERSSAIIKDFQAMKESIPTGAHIPLLFFLAMCGFDVEKFVAWTIVVPPIFIFFAYQFIRNEIVRFCYRYFWD